MLFRQHRVRKVAFKQKVRTSTRVMIRENQCERILRFGASSLWFFHKLRVIASSMSSVSTGSPRENMYPFKLEGAAIDGDPSGGTIVPNRLVGAQRPHHYRRVPKLRPP